MKTKILMVEHEPEDIELIQYELKKGKVNYISEIVHTEKSYENALRNFVPDIILSDYSLPSFDGPAAFEIKEKMAPHTPFIFVSGTIGEENSLELIKKGVTDYVLKDKLFTLIFKVNRALKEAKEKREKNRAALKLIQSESRLARAQQVAHMGSWELDLATGIAQWSDEACRIFGMDPSQTKQSLESFLTYTHPDDLDFVTNKIRISRDSLRDTSFYNRIVRADGTIRHVFSESKHEFDSSGKPIGLYGIVQDVTEKKEYENKILELNQTLELKVAQRTSQLQEINNDLESFSSSVSHDLRSPLQVISGYSSILLRKYTSVLDEEALTLLQGIGSYSKKMSQIMESLLELAHLGQDSVAKTKVSMISIVKIVVAELNFETNGEGREIKLQNIPDAGCDPRMMKQVWVNLISNAIKYSSQKEKPLIEIGSRELNKDVIYFVKDNGAGFDMKYVGNLFHAFQRLHNSSEFEGVGVGLTIVHRIITKHGGRIWAEGIEGEGATFYFTLPSQITEES